MFPSCDDAFSSLSDPDHEFQSFTPSGLDVPNVPILTFVSRPTAPIPAPATPPSPDNQQKLHPHLCPVLQTLYLLCSKMYILLFRRLNNTFVEFHKNLLLPILLYLMFALFFCTQMILHYELLSIF